MSDYERKYLVEDADVLKHFIGKYMNRIELINLLNSGYKIEMDSAEHACDISIKIVKGYNI